MLDTTRVAEEVAAGKTKTIGRLSLVVLHPEAGDQTRRTGNSEVNNGSVVVKAIYGESRYLFRGDCELGCWEELFKLHRAELRADVAGMAGLFDSEANVEAADAARQRVVRPRVVRPRCTTWFAIRTSIKRGPPRSNFVRSV